MRNLVLLAGAVSVVACESPTVPEARGLHVDASPRAAVVVNSRQQFVSAAINDCDGQVVPGVFQIHDVISVTFDAAAGLHVSDHTDIRGDLSNPASGVDYVVMQSQQNEFNVTAGFEQTSVLHFNMIAKGPTPNEELQAVQHITITPDGNVSVFTDSFTIHCQ